jgi:hypothetical protein
MINNEPDISIDNKVNDPSRLTLRLRIILAIVLIANTLDLMDSTITNIAAPSMETYVPYQYLFWHSWLYCRFEDTAP